MIAIWAVLSAVADPLFYVFAGPHIPPGDMTSSASGAQFDFNVLFVVALPVIIAVWVYMAYAIIMWRASRPGAPEPVGGPRARGHLGIQIGWIGLTTVIVLSMFVFGTYELIVPAGAGGGEGPNPIWKPASKDILPIQVIAQQWKFTYRYPTFGGMETSELVIPDHTAIAFHVTSLDVIHDFWAYQLGVKADANPGVTNTAYTTTKQLGDFVVRCDELCGIWHGAMYDYGKVLTQAAFESWANSTERELADNTKYLPAFSWTYTPSANTAAGSYYTSTQDPYSKVQKYGAVPAKVTK
jgi:cytochrome c oxidase subunit 2